MHVQDYTPLRARDAMSSSVVSIGPTHTLREAARRMSERKVGAVVVMDPQTGRVLAMSGGWAYGMSQFNRAVQAQRQPGSSFKPFVYLAAMDSGLTPSSIVCAPAVGKIAPVVKPSICASPAASSTSASVASQRP